MTPIMRSDVRRPFRQHSAKRHGISTDSIQALSFDVINVKAAGSLRIGFYLRSQAPSARWPPTWRIRRHSTVASWAQSHVNSGRYVPPTDAVANRVIDETAETEEREGRVWCHIINTHFLEISVAMSESDVAVATTAASRVALASADSADSADSAADVDASLCCQCHGTVDDADAPFANPTCAGCEGIIGLDCCGGTHCDQCGAVVCDACRRAIYRRSGFDCHACQYTMQR